MFIIIRKKHEILNWQPVLIIEEKNISDRKLISQIDKSLSYFETPKRFII